MAAPQNFRTAFNGFHKEDVVRYLEYINSKHSAQVNQLTSEADFLRSRVEALQAAPENDNAGVIAALEQERDGLRTQLEEMQARCAALEAELASKEQPAQAAPQIGPQEELEAYRRAERTERLAKERAEQLYHQTNAVLADAAARVDGVAGDIGGMADQVVAQLQQLQSAVTGSKQALQDAAAILYTIRPENM